MIKSALTALVATAMLVGCANQRFNVAGELSANPTPRSEDSQTFFVSGIGQQSSVNASKVCGDASKVEGVAVEQSGMDVLLGMVTLGIYTPRTARVYCK
ncbi:Bor family protein [uncultured Rhodoferax sp.]|uniref:Bor family protein n=1 Tax=uncultured Rhodoferax sp. TaxID=223188 RepID=UPI0025ED79B6|nr:Bor family protein [uncultured Rhodoferax sp.]